MSKLNIVNEVPLLRDLLHYALSTEEVFSEVKSHSNNLVSYINYLSKGDYRTILKETVKFISSQGEISDVSLTKLNQILSEKVDKDLLKSVLGSWNSTKYVIHKDGRWMEHEALPSDLDIKEATNDVCRLAELGKIYAAIDKSSGDPTLITSAINEIQTKDASWGFSKLTQVDIRSNEFKSTPYKSVIGMINRCSPTSSYINSQLVTVAAAPGAGKSLFLLNEALGFISQGAKVHYMAIGDLTPVDMLTRSVSIANKMDVISTYTDLDNTKRLSNSIRNIDNFSFTCLEADSISVEEYLSKMEKYLDDFDVFIVDYDSNFSSDTESMYDKGGNIYNKLVGFSRKGKLVLLASQPKNDAVGKSHIGMNQLSESSRKYQILDMLITLGSSNIYSKCGLCSIPKNRRGLLASTYYCISTSGIFHELNKSQYNFVKSLDRQLSEGELMNLNERL